MKKYIILFIGILGIAHFSNAQTSDEITIPFEGGTDQWLDVGIKYGKVIVKGSNRNDVHIQWELLHQKKSSNNEENGGLRKISTNGADLKIEETSDRIKVSSSNFSKGYLITVEVPQKMNIELSSFNEGDLLVENIEGVVDLNTYNGKIEANGIKGSVTANTFNGAIHVTFDEITSGVPMAFDTYNGEVDITLPPSTKASLKMKTKGGEILTGFDVDLKPAAELVKKEKENGARKVYIDGWIQGDINGGGAEFQMTNNWGNIYIRKGE